MLDRPPRRGPALAWQLTAPRGPVRGAVLVVHGYDEHHRRYDDVARVWSDRGLLVGRFDLRGHGRSEGPRGHIDSFGEYVRDVEDVLAVLDDAPSWRQAGRPVLFGHSLGGLIATHAVLRHPTHFSGLCMTSPFFGLAMRVPAAQAMLGRVMSRFLPRLSQPSKLKGAELTHDAARAALYDADPLRFRFVTARWFTETQKAQLEAMESAHSLRLPVYCLAAGDDRIVSVQATERFLARTSSDDKTFRVLDGLYHEILCEVDCEPFIAELAERMLEWASREAKRPNSSAKEVARAERS
jgi:alpha-beta hydrolase superfamily lysophospholipase